MENPIPSDDGEASKICAIMASDIKENHDDFGNTRIFCDSDADLAEMGAQPKELIVVDSFKSAQIALSPKTFRTNLATLDFKGPKVCSPNKEITKGPNLEFVSWERGRGRKQPISNNPSVNIQSLDPKVRFCHAMARFKQLGVHQWG